MSQRDVAVIGIGYWGKNLARNYHELGCLHSICDHNFNHLAYYQGVFDGVSCAINFEQVLDNPEINKVVIATPTKTHYALAKAALLAGKDVFVEKAMCETPKQAQELVDLAKAQERLLMVGHLLHYHPCVQKVKELLAERKLGKILHLSFSRLNFGSKGEEKSALWAFAPHDVSMLLSFVNYASLRSLKTTHKSFIEPSFMDQSWLHFEFEHGVSADIQVGWAFSKPDRKFSIIGTEGVLTFDDTKDWELKLVFSPQSFSVHQGKMNFSQQAEELIKVDYSEPLKNECQHFIECCLNRSNPITSGEEGQQVLEILTQSTQVELQPN